jgi:hypothetical protein
MLRALATGDFVYCDGKFAIGIVRLNTDGSIDAAFQLGGTDSFEEPLPSFIAPSHKPGSVHG